MWFYQRHAIFSLICEVRTIMKVRGIMLKKLLNVDSGSLCFCSVEELKKHGAISFDDGEIITLHPGLHEIHIDIADSWAGEVKVKKIITVGVESKFYIGDPCYCFPNTGDSWYNFIVATSHRSVFGYKEIPTGGDGSFEVEINIY